MCSCQNPAALNENSSADMLEWLVRVLLSYLQGHLPRQSPWSNLQTAENPSNGLSWLRLPACVKLL